MSNREQCLEEAERGTMLTKEVEILAPKVCSVLGVSVPGGAGPGGDWVWVGHWGWVKRCPGRAARVTSSEDT